MLQERSRENTYWQGNSGRLELNVSSDAGKVGERGYLRPRTDFYHQRLYFTAAVGRHGQRVGTYRLSIVLAPLLRAVNLSFDSKVMLLTHYIAELYQ